MDLSGLMVDLDIEGYKGFIWTLWWTLILKVILDLSELSGGFRY